MTPIVVVRTVATATCWTIQYGYNTIMIEDNNSVLSKLKLAIFLVLWYSTATGNGLFSRASSKYLMNAVVESSSKAILILQGSIALSFVQLLLTGVCGLGASYIQESINSHRTGQKSTRIGIVRSLTTMYTSRKSRQSTFLIGLLNFLGVVATNLSFFLGSVSLTHLIKSSEPLFTSMYSYIISPESSLSSKKFAGMTLITIGVATASYSNKASAYYGCAAALISSLLFPLRNVLIKKMVSKEDATINGIQLFFVIFFISSVIGVFVLLGMNISPIVRLPWIEHIVAVSSTPVRTMIYFDTVMSAVTFLCYNTFSMIVLQQCSVSTHAIFNILKRGVVILISAVLIDHNLNQHLAMGTGLAMVGLWLYKS